jgi:two-component system, cell cycle response regulator DivK
MSDPTPILCVEDNPLNLRLLRKVLSEAGFRVIDATDGPSAVAIAERERPHLILLDIHLPGFDGFEVFRRVRALPGMHAVRVIALTADVMRGDRNDVLAAGFDDYMSKPFRIDLLVQRIRALLAAEPARS